MEEGRDSKEYSWKWITASELLSTRPCDFCSILLTSTVNVGSVRVYDGENTNGVLIALMECLAKSSQLFEWKKPIYCRRGLYMEKIANIHGALVQWREIPQGVGYPK